jgi:DNA invertase Pin-like site-specific DNA recombinase
MHTQGMRSSNLPRPVLHALRSWECSDPRVVGYDRRSLRTDTSVSLAAQRAEILQVVARVAGARHDPARDWYFDDDVTATGHRTRNGWDALLAAIAGDGYDAIVTYEWERLTRNWSEAMQLVDFLRSHRVEVFSVRQPYLSLYGELSNLTIAFLADGAERESRTISERATSRHRLRAAHGAWRSSRIPFGMTTAMRPSPIEGRSAEIPVLIPDRTTDWHDGQSPAQIVEQIVGEVLNGATISQLCRQLNADGIPSPGRGLWRHGSLYRLLHNAHLAGMTIYRGEIVRNADGAPVSAGQAVLTPDTWTKLQDTLYERGSGDDGRSRRHHLALLARLVFCDHCRSLMTPSASNKRRRTGTYRCTTIDRESGRCPGNTISRASLEALIVGWYLTGMKPLPIEASKEPADVARSWWDDLSPNAQQTQIRNRLRAIWIRKATARQFNPARVVRIDTC